jgi:hypothetical protein
MRSLSNCLLYRRVMAMRIGYLHSKLTTQKKTHYKHFFRGQEKLFADKHILSLFLVAFIKGVSSSKKKHMILTI